MIDNLSDNEIDQVNGGGRVVKVLDWLGRVLAADWAIRQITPSDISTISDPMDTKLGIPTGGGGGRSGGGGRGSGGGGIPIVRGVASRLRSSH